MIANCQLPISDFKFLNRQLAIDNDLLVVAHRSLHRIDNFVADATFA